MTGVSGSFAACLKGVENLLAHDISVMFLVILNRMNHHEIQDLLHLADGLGVPTVGILRLYPIGRARKNWAELACSLEEMTNTIESLVVPDSVDLMQSWHPKNGNCCWENAAVTATGDSVGCPYLREYVNYGNIASNSFFETWGHPHYRRLRETSLIADDHCPDCTNSERTRGGCRATAYAFHRDWDAADPFCKVLNKGIDLRVLPVHP